MPFAIVLLAGAGDVEAWLMFWACARLGSPSGVWLHQPKAVIGKREEARFVQVVVEAPALHCQNVTWVLPHFSPIFVVFAIQKATAHCGRSNKGHPIGPKGESIAAFKGPHEV